MEAIEAIPVLPASGKPIHEDPRRIMSETLAERGTPTRATPFISRVRLKNYKSIAQCDVRLEPLTILVGPNGSGKSNFLDALEFLCRAVATSPNQALEERGGLESVLRRVPEMSSSFSIEVEVAVPWWPASPEIRATYGIEIGRVQDSTSGVAVLHESGVIRGPDGTATLSSGSGRADLSPAGGHSNGIAVFEPDRLILPVAGTQGAFAQLYTGLTLPRFYHFRTEVLRRPQRALRRAVLRRHGEGLGDVLAALSVEHRSAKTRIDSYVSAIACGSIGLEARDVGDYKTVVLNTNVDGEAFDFGSEAMSEGTVRSVAVLAALFQPESLSGRLPLIGIEEPEIALHPAAAGVLFDALTEASEHVQVIATSQSADLLDREDLDPAVVRPVAMEDGLTLIGEVDDVSQEIVKQKLYTLGELMRGNQLSPQMPQEAAPEA
jgi:predicted ATPase